MTASRSLTTDHAEVKRAFAAFPSGVAAVSAHVHGEPAVIVVSSFTVGVSLHPPMVSFAVQHTSTTWPMLSRADTVGVSILGENHTDKTRQLASPAKEDRFDGVDTVQAPSGAIFLDGAPVWLECAVEHRYPAGDHDIIVLRVLAMLTDDDHRPLVWHRQTLKMLNG
ncbi:flavin reductase family protein [Streptomyces sp. NBC_00285]|uniref:flavin reductase family protein n=1 Tax=Streptomyces sp. NBC_00285 TaxID=2975700 RepID=UPI002E2E1264|nr:flavin reductase family protein [Streptomyces sp. NBC_00285]